MKKYRFKTKHEFISEKSWRNNSESKDGGYPSGWYDAGEMNYYLGKEVPESLYEYIEKGKPFRYKDPEDGSLRNDDWIFYDIHVIEEEELTLEQLKEKMNLILNNK